MRRNNYTPTPHEIDVLHAVARHGTLQGAADALHLSRHTVDAHMDHLRNKTGLRYLPQLVAWAAENSWFLGELRTR
jgi:DNA-binding CsgD family transcriptional regulator